MKRQVKKILFRAASFAFRLFVCFAFIATCSLVPTDGWGQTNSSQTDDLQPLIDEVENLVIQVEDANAKNLIQARLIGIQYLRGEKDEAMAEWEVLLGSLLDVDRETEPDRLENRFNGGVQVSNLAGRQLRMGNQPLAMIALERLDGELGSFFCHINLILAAGSRNDIELARKLFERGKADNNVQFASRRNFGMNLEDALVHAQLQSGDLEGALDTLELMKAEGYSGGESILDQKLKIAALAEADGKKDMAASLLKPIIATLDKNQNGLHFKLQFVKTHMLWAKLNPNELHSQLNQCVEVLENHEGINGPGSGYNALASHLAEMGKFELATEALEKLQQENMQQRAFKKIVVCQAEQGNLMEAQATLDSIHVESIRLEAELSIAKKAYALGKREKAKQMLAESIDRALASHPKETQVPDSFWTSATNLQTKWNQKQKALDWVRAIPDPAVKADCLLSIIEQSYDQP